jgi:tripartite-type tricarboxylate transporter receptor subunit TctC
MAFDYMVGAGSLIGAGKLVPLMVVGDRRLEVLPNVPTAGEVGVPAVNLQGWAGFLAPARTPNDIITRLNRELVALIRSPEMMQTFAPSGMQVVASSADEFARLIQEEQKKFSELIEVTGVQAK